ncbi:MAG: hypothetical protein ACP5N3_05605 [Candidatus Nanoarchaeia archaeon]
MLINYIDSIIEGKSTRIYPTSDFPHLTRDEKQLVKLLKNPDYSNNSIKIYKLFVADTQARIKIKGSQDSEELYRIELQKYYADFLDKNRLYFRNSSASSQNKGNPNLANYFKSLMTELPFIYLYLRKKPKHNIGCRLEKISLDNILTIYSAAEDLKLIDETGNCSFMPLISREVRAYEWLEMPDKIIGISLINSKIKEHNDETTIHEQKEAEERFIKSIKKARQKFNSSIPIDKGRICSN